MTPDGGDHRLFKADKSLEINSFAEIVLYLPGKDVILWEEQVNNPLTRDDRKPIQSFSTSR
jgi:hypothetical protein